MGSHVEFERWQQDHQLWQQQIAFWQHEIQRLVALLYMLEKALPVHNSELSRHKTRIARQNAEVNAQCRLLAKQQKPSSDVIQHNHRYLIKSLETRHQDIRAEHQRIAAIYEQQFNEFRQLATRLVSELEQANSLVEPVLEMTHAKPA